MASNKLKKYIPLGLLVAVFALSFIVAAYAQSYDYAITSDYHGVDVNMGTPVTATATTNDPTVNRVTFLWKDGAKILRFTDADIPLVGGAAQSTYSPDLVGDWGVQAFFQDSDGNTIQGVVDVVAIRATSMNVIPEIPLLGTAGIAIAMVLGLAYRMRKQSYRITN